MLFYNVCEVKLIDHFCYFTVNVNRRSLFKRFYCVYFINGKCSTLTAFELDI